MAAGLSGVGQVDVSARGCGVVPHFHGGAAEHASLTTTNKQIARAKRILRDLDISPGGGQ